MCKGGIMTRGGPRPGAGRPETKDPKIHTIRLTNSEKEFIEFSRIKKINLTKLKKSLLVLVAIFMLAMPANATTLKAGIEYTVDSARVVAFQDTDITIPTSEFSGVLSDIFYYSNIEAIKAGRNTAGIGFTRKLVPFYDKNNKLSFYGVQTEDQPNKKLYYSPTGKLLKYEINTFKGVYPYKTIAYDTKGHLLNINLVVSDNEAFIFNKDKKLIAHWLDNKCYNEKGEVDLTKRP